MIKPFDRGTHEQFDPLAGRETQKIMENIFGAQYVRTNKESEGFKDGKWDQMYTLDGSVILTEAEIKDAKWWGRKFVGTNYKNSTKQNPHPFEWPSVDIPERKKDNLALLYFVISSACDLAWIVSRDNVLSSKTKDKRCRVKMGGEWTYILDQFFEVSAERGIFLEKTNGGWKLFTEADNDRLKDFVNNRILWEQKLTSDGRNNLLITTS